jgi:hypothetical protein
LRRLTFTTDIYHRDSPTPSAIWACPGVERMRRLTAMHRGTFDWIVPVNYRLPAGAIERVVGGRASRNINVLRRS